MWLGGQWGDPGLPGQPPRLVWAGCYARLAALTPNAPLTHVQKPGAYGADPQEEAGQWLVPYKGEFLELQQV